MQAQTAVQAGDYINSNQYEKAYELIVSDVNYRSDAYLQYLLGLCYLQSNDSKNEASACFLKAFDAKENKNDTRIPGEVYYYLGISQHYNGDFLGASNYIADYLNFHKKIYNDTSNSFYRQASYMLDICRGAVDLYNSFQLKNTTARPLDFPLNSSYNDFYPVIPSISSQLMYSSDRRTDFHVVDFGQGIVFIPPSKKSVGYNVFYGLKNDEDSVWDVQADQINFGYNYVAPVSYSSDGNTLLLLAGETKESCKLFKLDKKNGAWQTPELLPESINDLTSNINGACLSANGNHIYFSSNRAGGLGGYDIYWTYKVGDNWAKPENLGRPINTNRNEITPYVSANMEDLYFSSDGHRTLGYYDIFISKREGSAWSHPTNMGFPINSTYNDICYTRSSDGEKELFSSDREVFISQEASILGNANKNEFESNVYTHGNYDIFEVKRDQEVMPLCIVYGKLSIKKDGNKVPFLMRVISASDKVYQPFVFEPKADDDKYFMVLPGDGSYSMDIIFAYDSVEKQTPMNTIQHFPVYDTLYDFQFTVPVNSYQYEFNANVEINTTEVFGSIIQKDVKGTNNSFNVTNVDEVGIEKKLREIRLDALVLIMDKMTDLGKKELFDEFGSIEQKIEYEISSQAMEPDPTFANLMNNMEMGFETGDRSYFIGLTEVMRHKDGISFKPKEITVSQNSNVLFTNRNKLTDEAKRDLQKLADWIKDDPESKVEIVYNGDINSNDDQKRLEEIMSFMKSKKAKIEQITGYMLSEYPVNQDRLIKFTLKK
ncbi:hypothetical protein [Chondrinema litorale]|uniref:hypothetical protein n=1 Tax=Chondrinema litorale TaxID=2994555 RepID=UPI002543A41A|nr:hypothetical protein [Chondrinema litorale]UZR94733.1 hypothetical protein OQ292_02745 [Chondrinema litorale]